ncbi:MAG: hypothetical protein ACE361_23850 [Aureliella sp.]
MKYWRTISFSLLSIFSWTFGCAVLVAATRFFALNPRMLAPALVVGFFVVVLIAPSFASRLPLPAKRVGLGCCLIPASYVMLAIAYSVLVYLLRIAIVPN